MAKSQAGDSQCYQQLLQEIYPVIKRFLAQRIGPDGLHEDATQECLTAIHNARQTYDPKRKFQPWMFAIVRYKSIDILRKNQKQWAREVSDEKHSATFAAPTTNTYIEDEKEIVNNALKDLPEEMKRAVISTKFNGMSLKETAKAEGISDVALRSRISRAYKILRKKLEKEIANPR